MSAVVTRARDARPIVYTPSKSPDKPRRRPKKPKPHAPKCTCIDCRARAAARAETDGASDWVHAEHGRGVPGAEGLPLPAVTVLRGSVALNGPDIVDPSAHLSNLRSVSEWCLFADPTGWKLDVWLLFVESMALAFRWYDELVRFAQDESTFATLDTSGTADYAIHVTGEISGYLSGGISQAVERKLLTEDEDVLRKQIDRYLTGKKTTLLKDDRLYRGRRR
jgi:hypothetical protein